VYPIIIEYIDKKTFKINSTATDLDTGSSTTIKSYDNILYFGDFMDNAITSISDVELQPNTDVTGDVHYNGELVNHGGNIDGDLITDPIEGWPTAEQLHDYYWPHVKDLDPPWYEYPNATIDLKDTGSIPLGLYRVGDLTITNTGSAGAALQLFGTVYVTGNLEFQQTGNKDYEIHLSGQTIYVEGNIDFPSDRCTVYGDGCIIAVGDIDFQPSMQSEEDDFVFVMSVEGTVNFQPSGDFYGSIAGNINVNLQPGSNLVWTGPPPTLKYPGSDSSENNVIQAILTWEISLHKTS
jgi:cytoskeletal protein CcmA (bactofilin family)